MPGHGFDDGAQPQIVVQVGGQQTKDFQLEPAFAPNDGDEPERKNGASREAVDRPRLLGQAVDRDRRESEQEGQTRDHLRIVAQRVRDHSRGRQEQQYQVDPLCFDDSRGGHVVHGVGDKEQKRPTAANTGARENAIAVVAFEKHSRGQHAQARRVPYQDLAGRSQSRQLVRHPQRNPDDQEHDGQLVEPVLAQLFLDVERVLPRNPRGRRRGWRRRPPHACWFGRGGGWNRHGRLARFGGSNRRCS